MTRPVVFSFRLFIAGDTLNSAQAVANLSALCRIYLPEHHNIEIVDVFRQPRRALQESVLMTPTLIKLGPKPTVRIIGTLNQTELVLQALGLGVLVS